MRALDRLARMKGQFGRDAASATAQLLGQLAKVRFRDPADLIRLHETALFLRAYPQSAAVVKLADQILFSFNERLKGVDPAPFEDPAISGIAGTTISTNFSYEIARSLTSRHRSIDIDWENYERPDRLGMILARLYPPAAEEWTVEPHVDTQRWFQKANASVAWLLDHLSSETYDLLEIPLRWDLGDSDASRSRGRLPVPEMFYHDRLLKRSEVSIASEFSSPQITANLLPPPQATKVMDQIIDTSCVRYRELWGFTHPDVAHFYHANLGRGVDLFFFGLLKKFRLPVRGYVAGMFFKNGVPMGYVEGLSKSGTMEMGFNLYYTFREGETAWLYARLLKVFHERLKVNRFTIDPYQLGHENEEAIASGAFWFYRKLGFQASTPEIARVLLREEERLAEDPGYRSPAPILRRLAEASLVFEP